MENFIDAAVRQTLEENGQTVEEWRIGTPKTWGFLAGRAVGNARRVAARDLTEAERRQVWAVLWAHLQALR